MKGWITVAATLLALGVPASASAWNPLRSENSDVNEGNELMAQQKYEPALEAYDRAADELPKAPGVQLNRGLALLGQGDHEAARAAFLAAAAPETPRKMRADAYYNLGLSFARQGDALAEEENHEQSTAQFQEAVDAFKRSLRMNPGNQSAAWNLEYAMRRLQEQQQEEQQQGDEQQEQEEQEQGDQGEEQQERDEGDQGEEQEQQEQEQGDQGDQQQQQQEQEQHQEQAQQQEDQQNQQSEGPSSEEQTEPREQPIAPDHVQRFLDALEQTEESLPVQRARRRGAGRRPPEKDW